MFLKAVYSHVVSSLLLMPQMTMGGDASNKEGGRRVVVLNGWLGMGLHCSSQIGMTKIMEIYKAGNIYGRSEGLFRVGVLFANYATGCENMRFCDCSSALAADAAASS